MLPEHRTQNFCWGTFRVHPQSLCSSGCSAHSWFSRQEFFCRACCFTVMGIFGTFSIPFSLMWLSLPRGLWIHGCNGHSAFSRELGTADVKGLMCPDVQDSLPSAVEVIGILHLEFCCCYIGMCIWNSDVATPKRVSRQK